ncbi:MAG: hypothetical protein Q9191_008321, partial [Dirinaria sp. TL-2023a]
NTRKTVEIVGFVYLAPFQKSLTMLRHMWPDPYIWHENGKVTTTVFYRYRGHIDYDNAWNCAMAMLLAATEHTNIGAGGESMGSASRRWTWRHDDVELNLFPGDKFTWTMLLEQFDALSTMSQWGVEFQFWISVPTERYEIAIGDMSSASNQTADN